MNLKKKELINLPVYTQGEQHLGKIVDFELEPTSQTVEKYYIKSQDIIKNLLQKELLISKDQVVSISHDRMVVEDSVVKEKVKGVVKKAVPAG